MLFRKDINGLRAIAVIAVVIYHFNSALLPGGFAGVDIFFVISGFLMTGIIFNGLEKKSFSISKFYLARAKRIFPALAFLCFVLLLFGWFYFLNNEYQTLNKNVLGSLTFTSNFIYWKDGGGYFAPSAELNWLLHTWSLSVEWQFYMIYPVVIVAMKSLLSLKTIKYILLFAAIIGYLFCIVMSYKFPDPSYYLLPTRAWEMLFGGIAYLFPFNLKKQSKVKLEFIGITLILISYLFMSENDLWPGYLSILPVLGAFFILQSQRNDSLITNNYVFQSIGKWSYSIYLWHWPILVFFKTFHIAISPFYIFMIGILLSIITGILSFNLIENNKKLSNTHLIISALILSTFTFTAINNAGFNHPLRSMSLDSANTWVDRYRSYIMDPTKMFDDCNASERIRQFGEMDVHKRCVDNLKQGGIFFWGDSHMAAISTGLRETLPKHLTTHQLTSSGCPPSFKLKQGNISIDRRACDYSNELAYDSIKNVIPDIVVMAQKQHHEKNDWEETASTLKNLGVKKVIIVGPVPQWYPSLPIVYGKKHTNNAVISSQHIDKRLFLSNKDLLGRSIENSNFVYIDLLNNICSKDQDTYACTVIYNNELLVYDDGHLTIEGSKYIAEKHIIPVINDLEGLTISSRDSYFY